MGIARSTVSKATALQGKVLCVLIILSLLGQAAPILAREPISVAGGAPAAQQPAEARSGADRIPAETWLVTWEASVEANASGNGVFVNRNTHANASIVVNYYDDGTSDYYANQYIITHLVDLRHYDPCSDGAGQSFYQFRAEVLDPTRYNGRGPVTPNTVMPYKPLKWAGNQWNINALNLLMGGLETDYYRENSGCGNRSIQRDNDHDSLDFKFYLTSYVLAPFNSTDGPLFEYKVDTTIQETDFHLTYPIRLKEYVRVELVSGRDLKVRNIEVTQGLQLNNDIPLVQGRRTIVRAFIDTGGEQQPVQNVTGILRVWDGATLLGERRPYNGSITAKSMPDWHQINDALFFTVPWHWVQHPDLRFEVIVNDRWQINEINYKNNSSSVELPLRDCKLLKIGYLPVRYAPPGFAPASPGTDIAHAPEFMRKVYPVADDELLYLPMPGITWKTSLDGNTYAESFSNGQKLVHYLRQIYILSNNPGVERIVGWLPANASMHYDSMSEIIQGNVAWVEQDKAPLDLWRVLLAHELGFTYKANYSTATTGGYHWFDVYERKIKPATIGQSLAGFMLPPSPLPEQDTWVAPQTYNALYRELCSGGSGTSRPAQAQAADVLVISGNVSLTATQSGQLEPLIRTTGTLSSPPAGSDYFVVLKNGATELAKYGFDAYLPIGAGMPYTPTVTSFALGVPYPAGVNLVELTDRYGHTLSSRVASAHAPAVTVQFPNAPGLTLDGVQTLQWTGSDADGGALNYSVLYSKDNGVTWNAIAANISETSYAVDFATIPGSASALIKVLASDGFLTAGDVSDQPFNVSAKAPVAGIISPPGGEHFTVGEEIILQGYAVDLEEGMIASDRLSWSSDLDGALGTGSIREVTLSEGTHTITLDVSGGAASATMTVVVEAPPPPPQRLYTYLPLVLR